MIKFKSVLMAQPAILVFIFVFLSSASWAATYYVDATNGNDNNHGLSQSMAWRTIAEVNSSSFQPGDRILFKRGGVWGEQLTISSSGSPGNPITFGVYGSGNRPVINGANIFSNWTSEGVAGFTAYYAVCSTSSKQVFQNGSRLTKVNSKYDLTPGTWWWDSNQKRIYIRTTGNNHPGAYTIEISRRDYGIQIIDESYITVENIEIENTNDKGLNILAYRENMNEILIRNIISSHNYHMGMHSTGMNGRRINNVIVENSVFNYNGADGIVITGNSDNFTIRKNTVHNNCILDTPGDTELVWTGGIRAISLSVDNVIIEENVVYSNGKLNGKPVVANGRGYGIWFDTIGPGGIMRRNSVHGNRSIGIRVEVTSDAKVYYNISHNNSIGVAVARQVHRNEIYNNVAYDNSFGGIMVKGDSPAEPNNCTNNIVKNNIATGNTIELDVRFGGENDGTAGYGNVYENNCFGVESDKFIMWANMEYIDTYDAWESAYGANTHSVESDPLFTNANNSDFALQSSSPAIDAGVDVGLTHDFNNTAIAPFTPVDIGAIEYQGSYVDPPSQLRIVSVDSEELTGEPGAAENAIDGWSDTFWHTEWYYSNPKHPHEIIIKLSDIYNVKGFRYLPRQDGRVEGTVANYTFYVSNDGVSWGQPVVAGTLNSDTAEKEVTFSGKIGQYIRFVALSEIGGNPWTSMAEINILGNYVSSSKVIPQTQMSIVSVDSEELTGEPGAAENAIDGRGNTFWHTEWYYSDPKHPHEIIIKLNDIYNVKGFRYFPRQDGRVEGTVADYTFYVSNDGVSWGQPAAEGTFYASTADKEVTFSEKIGQYIRFVALSEIDGNPWTSMAEISILGSDVN